MAIESSGDNGFADIDHLRVVQLVRPVGVPNREGAWIIG
ncbi:hypothetical protein SynWH8103_02167 [Synechococcus sp. WH 8103]|nr:hypothetical protein SynWH8103_02167 [Synechococcus sp. WH 8103]